MCGLNLCACVYVCVCACVCVCVCEEGREGGCYLSGYVCVHLCVYVWGGLYLRGCLAQDRDCELGVEEKN